MSKKQTLDLFLERVKKIHGNKYEYLNLESFMPMTKVLDIKCSKHGIFHQTVNNHLNMKQGCPKCYYESKIGKTKLTTEQFIEKARKVHGDKYDYSITKYVGMKKLFQYICPKHGIQEQIAYDHLRGFGCKYCKADKDRLTKDEFITKAKEVHGDRYDYSKVDYVNNHTLITIICKKCRKSFNMYPSHHLMGMGCHHCNCSRLELEINNLLTNNKINFIPQCTSTKLKWLNNLSLDFYLPKYKIAIECQGLQHFKSIEYFGGNEGFERRKQLDAKKKLLCNDNNINLLYYANYNYEFPYQVFTDKQQLLEEIKKVAQT